MRHGTGHVLIVDDSPTVRLRLQKAIERARPETRVDEASSAEAGLARFLRGGIDLVFLDMMLDPHAAPPSAPPAEEDLGRTLDLMRRILDDAPATPIVLVTALPREHPAVVRAMSLGAAGYLEKDASAAKVAQLLGQIEHDH